MRGIAESYAWTSLGQIFDPREHNLPSNCSEYAQSPQAVVLADRVRVYFSTRERDTETTYLSHVAYVDFSSDFTETLDVSSHQILELGALGTFDEHGIFPINVLAHDGLIHGFTTGWNRKVSVPVDTAIGHVVSIDNGRTFQRNGAGPVMAASLIEPYLIADGFVLEINGLLHMWYIFGTQWKIGVESGKPERVYKIAHAISPDGERWQRDGKQIVVDLLGADECQALPTVFELDGKYHMYFCFRGYDGFRSGAVNSYKLGYAVSDDLQRWTRDDSLSGLSLPTGAWDAEMQCYPHVTRVGDERYLLYNGNTFGRYGFGCARLDRTTR